MITSHPTDMILPSLPCPLSHDALLKIFTDNYQIQAARYPQVGFITLYFNYNEISLLSILVTSLYICLFPAHAGQFLRINQVWIIFANAIGFYLTLSMLEYGKVP